ncbi:hypothetical protein MSS2_01847 [Mycobacterium marinum]|nr:hypothetical protein MSS2_01847 [Mycobacterium marinum]RFZ60484.1 hypothetical protein DE4576_05553 [Mycobacterium marinum]
MLAGYMPIWATDITESNGTAAAADCTPATTPGSPAIAPSAAGEIAAVIAVAAPATCALIPAARPAKSNGGVLNGVNAAATEVAPAS